MRSMERASAQCVAFRMPKQVQISNQIYWTTKGSNLEEPLTGC